MPTEATFTKAFGDVIDESLAHFFDQLDGQAPPPDLYKFIMNQVEKRLILKVFKINAGNQTRTAEMLGLARGTCRKKLEQYGITWPL